MNFTPVYRLPFVKPGEPITESMERIRYMTIDRQLESLFTFLGDGVMTGWSIIQHPDKDGSIILRAGSGVADSIAVATNVEQEFSLPSIGGDTVYYIYVKVGSSTPYTAAGRTMASTTLFDTPAYLILGTVTVNSQSKVINIDTSEASGRSELTFLNFLISSISNHVHTGAPGEPGKIDLYNHVKGVLSAAHLEDLPASKITSGIFDKERFRLSHSDLDDAGTLTHSQIDSLIGKFQNINKLLFGDLMTSNLIQLILSLKHVWEDVDDYFYNFMALVPGIDNNKFLNSQSFIDSNATNAEVDYLNHRIKGKYVPSKEIGQYVINSVGEFSYDGDGSLSYNPIYIVISGRDDEYGYGYGYGFGEGLDYFDVLQGPYNDSGVLTVGVSGTTVGYGLPEFETTFAGQYGYGYGYEEFTGFTSTLTSTRITLVPDSSSRTLHDKEIDNGGLTLSDSYYVSYGSSNNLFTNDQAGDTLPNQIQFISIASDNSDVYNKRNDDNMYSFTSVQRKITGEDRMDADQAASCLYWPNGNSLDLSVDNYLFFTFAQVKYRRGTNDSIQEDPDFTNYLDTFDSRWSPDLTMDLIIESTVTRGSSDLHRVFHKFAVGGNESINHFLDIKDNEFFENKRYYPEGYNFAVDAPALARIQAQIKSENMVYLGAYQVRTTPTSTMTIDEAQDQIGLSVSAGIVGGDPLKAESISNVTGLYFYTKNHVDYGFDYISPTARSAYFPMGRRNYNVNFGSIESPIYFGAGLKESYNPPGPPAYEESTMLVDLDSITVGGTPGFRYDPDNNVVRDLTITFPDPVALNSISWISSEPSDTIVYILTKRLDSLDGVDSVYNQNSIFTNNGTRLNDAQLIDPVTGKADNPIETAFISGPISPSAIDFEAQMAQKYRPSGSDFPSEYQSVRSVSFKVVLLPSDDLAVAPTLSSITVNYTSNTREGDLVISTEDQWSNYRSQTSIVGGTEGSVDYVTIDMPTDTTPVIGKVQNLLYGTDGAIIEVGNSNGTWLDGVKVFSGTGPTASSILPLTVHQQISKDSYGISGYVTNLQKRPSGNIVFLDQNSNRIIELDINYGIEKIIASELAYKNTTANWMPRNLSSEELEGGLLRAIYNADLGSSGVLYLVFSHELKAWDALYSKGIDENVSDYDPTSEGYVDLSLIQMVVQATDVNFTDCTAYAVDRGIICIELSESKNNFISGNLANEIKFIFNTESRDIVLAPNTDPVATFVAANDTASGGVGGSCAVFKGDVIVRDGLSRVPIEKPDYSIIFAPIQGIVGFDVDDDEAYYILKKPRPYPKGTDIWTYYDEDSHPAEPWYVKMSGTALWDGWIESTSDNSSENKEVFTISNLGKEATWEPNFSTGSIYGDRGTIQKKDNFLLICISGEKDSSSHSPDGVYIFNKTVGSSSGSLYGGPEEFKYIFDLEDDYYDDTYLMAARFDPLTYDEDTNTFGSIYVAVSDLKRSSSINSKSKIVKIDPTLRKIAWEWGTKADRDSGLSNSFALVINDVMPLSYNDTEVIVST